MSDFAPNYHPSNAEKSTLWMSEMRNGHWQYDISKRTRNLIKNNILLITSAKFEGVTMSFQEIMIQTTLWTFTYYQFRLLTVVSHPVLRQISSSFYEKFFSTCVIGTHHDNSINLLSHVLLREYSKILLWGRTPEMAWGCRGKPGNFLY